MWFVSQPAEVEAFQFLKDQAIDSWIVGIDFVEGVKEVKAFAMLGDQKIYLEHGDWIIKDGDDYSIMKDHIFKKQWAPKFPEGMRTVVQQQLNAWCDGFHEQTVLYYRDRALGEDRIQMIIWLARNGFLEKFLIHVETLKGES